MAGKKEEKKKMKFKVGGTFYTSATIMKRPSITGFLPPILIECICQCCYLSESVCKARYEENPNKVQRVGGKGSIALFHK